MKGANYITSKKIPQDIFYIIGKFLSGQKILLLKDTAHPLFNKNSVVYRELYDEVIDNLDPEEKKFYPIPNKSSSREKVTHVYNSIMSGIEKDNPLLIDYKSQIESMFRIPSYWEIFLIFMGIICALLVVYRNMDR
jgi:hypothetical protein